MLKEKPNAKYVPQVSSKLRHHILRVPSVVRNASGIVINGRRIKSLVFTTDIAIIRNCNADAVLAVYPFTPQPAITRAVMTAADMPVFVGVGGGVTRGRRVVNLAKDAEFEGAFGVVVNAPTDNEVVHALKQELEIPIVVTVVSDCTDVGERLEAGADIINVSGAARTPEIVAHIREQFPKVPIIATGGPTEETITATIRAGANAITYSPPSNGELFRQSMERYRREAERR